MIISKVRSRFSLTVPSTTRWLSTSRLTRDVRICFIGDSFVAGTGDSHHLGWTGRLCARIEQSEAAHITEYNLGIRRNTSSDVRSRWLDETTRRLPSNHPDTFERRIVLSFGVNDCVEEYGRRRIDEHQSISNVKAIIAGLPSHWQALFIGPPPTTTFGGESLNERINALDAKIEVACSEADVPFLSVFGKLCRNPSWCKEATAGDGIHPDSEGYAALSELIFDSSVWKMWFSGLET